MRSVLFIIFAILVIIECEFCLWKIVFSKDQEEKDENKRRLLYTFLFACLISMDYWYN